MGIPEGAATSYDQVLYPIRVYPQTDPNRLAAIGFLRGLLPAPIDRCRVLEFGCGTGANLIAMAFRLPGSEFLGLDLARKPIASGRSFVTELGLRNIALHATDLADASTEQFGSFDFIIAHGLYSWVPGPVRERILAICRELLNPQGVAYISYNAYPGNHFRDLVRGMMRFHTARFEGLTDKVGQARGLLKFLAESQANPDYYAEAIRAEFERAVKYPDEAFFHDDLSEINQPFYFYEFIGDADRYGLQFVGEARANDLDWKDFTPEVRDRMKELEGASEIVREQFKDFLRARSFRQTVLCRKEVRLSPALLADRVPKLYAMCDAKPVEAHGARDSCMIFRRPTGVELKIEEPAISAAVELVCSRWPGSASFQMLLEAARTAVVSESAAGFVDEASLADALIRAYEAGFLHLHVNPHSVASQVGERPAASKLARLQLRHGDFATSQLHTSVHFPDILSRQLILLLDGTRDQEALVREMNEFVKSGQAHLYENGVLVENRPKAEAILEQRIQEDLRSLVRDGMLLP